MTMAIAEKRLWEATINFLPQKVIAGQKIFGNKAVV